VPEIVDSGDFGKGGTYRTNVGLNNLGPEAATVRLELVVGGGVIGATTVQVPSKGLRQLDNVARTIIVHGGPTHVRGYMRVSSSQPLHVWASKIENLSDDPSIVMGTP